MERSLRSWEYETEQVLRGESPDENAEGRAQARGCPTQWWFILNTTHDERYDSQSDGI